MATKEDRSQVPDQNLAPKSTPHKAVSFVRSSKFRHIEGQLSHRSSAIDKVPAISSTVPGDSNAFAVNKERVGVVLSVPGGQVAVLEVSNM
jgi:coronin-7